MATPISQQRLAGDRLSSAHAWSARGPSSPYTQARASNDPRSVTSGERSSKVQSASLHHGLKPPSGDMSSSKQNDLSSSLGENPLANSHKMTTADKRMTPTRKVETKLDPLSSSSTPNSNLKSAVSHPTRFNVTLHQQSGSSKEATNKSAAKVDLPPGAQAQRGAAMRDNKRAIHIGRIEAICIKKTALQNELNKLDKSQKTADAEQAITKRKELKKLEEEHESRRAALATVPQHKATSDTSRHGPGGAPGPSRKLGNSSNRQASSPPHASVTALPSHHTRAALATLPQHKATSDTSRPVPGGAPDPGTKLGNSSNRQASSPPHAPVTALPSHHKDRGCRIS